MEKFKVYDMENKGIQLEYPKGFFGELTEGYENALGKLGGKRSEGNEKIIWNFPNRQGLSKEERIKKLYGLADKYLKEISGEATFVDEGEKILLPPEEEKLAPGKPIGQGYTRSLKQKRPPRGLKGKIIQTEEPPSSFQAPSEIIKESLGEFPEILPKLEKLEEKKIYNPMNREPGELKICHQKRIADYQRLQSEGLNPSLADVLSRMKRNIESLDVKYPPEYDQYRS